MGFIQRTDFSGRMDKSEEEAVIDQLTSVPLFSHLSGKDLKTVARSGTLRSYVAGDRIVTKGEKGLGFFLILDGRVEVKRDGKVIATLAPGAFFGEMALFEELPRTADVVAAAPSRCLVLTRWDFWGSMTREPEVLRALITEMARRLHETTKSLSE